MTPGSLQRDGARGRTASLALFVLAGAAAAGAAQQPATAARPGAAEPPPPPPAALAALVGEYGRDTAHASILLERSGKLYLHEGRDNAERLLEKSGPGWRAGRDRVMVLRDARGRVGGLLVAGTAWPRIPLGPEAGAVFRIRPIRNVDSLRTEALAASPPAETGEFLPTDLTELVTLDSTIHLDIRYAGTRNFMGTPLYSQGRAFLQRQAAEALVRAHHALRERGYGLLIHDGYRPWYVTKMFWDATPAAQHEFVANPATGSRHNRGCAVDLTLYDLRTGQAVEMPGTYDEFSRRSYPTYPGGTTRQRWFRELLRTAMEAEGFTVNESEWWHFDYRDWKRYRIGNVAFERLGRQ